MQKLVWWIAAACLACPVAKGASAELKVQLGHSEPITSVAFSPDGRWVLTGSNDGSALLWDVATGREIRRFEGNFGNPYLTVTSAAFSPDARFIVTGSSASPPGSVIGFSPDVTAGSTARTGTRLWDVATGREVRRFEGDSDAALVNAVAFSPDGRSVLSCVRDGGARLWDVSTGREIRRFEGDSAGAFSSDGRSILTAGRDKTVRLWDAATGREIRRFTGHWVSSVAFSPDGRSILTSEENRAQLWDAASGREIRRFEGEPEPPFRDASTMPGRDLQPDYVSSTAFSPDGRWVLSGIQDGTARLWEVATGHEIRRFKGHSDGVAAVAFSPDGHSVLTGSYDNTARLWDAATGREIRRFEGYADSANSVAFSFDGRSALIASGNAPGILDVVQGREILPYGNAARLWDFASGREIRRFAGVSRAALSPDGQSILTVSPDKTARLWERTASGEINRFAIGQVNAMAFSPDGRSVLAGGSDSRTARLWDVAAGREIRPFESHSAGINSVAFSPDGLSALTDGEQWDVATGRAIRRFDHIAERTAHPPPSNAIDFGFSVESAAFSADGRFLLTANSDHMARLWDVAKGSGIRQFEGGYGIAALSPHGESVLTGSFDRTARLWDVATGREIHRFERTYGFAAFSPDGRTVLTGSADGTTNIRDTNSGRLLATLVTYRGAGWAVVAPDGRFDTSELDGASALHWIVDDDPMRPLPLEIFMRQYYTPRLLPRLLAGEKLPQLANIAALNRVQPEVTIRKLEPDAKHAGRLRATVSVKSQTNRGQASGARDLRLFRDGQLVAFHEGGLKNGEYVFDGIRLPHRGPKQPLAFTAYAFNTDLVKSPTAARTYTLPDTWPELRGRAFLVDIGVNRMAASGCSLQYAVADATAMQSALQQRLAAAGYTVEPHLLIADDSRPNGSSKDRWRSVLADIASRATPDDTFILTYSGHGYSDPDGMFYLFPSDLRGNCGKVDFALLRSAVSSGDLTNWIRPIDAGEMVMILDACYSAASIESGDFKPGPMGNRGLGQLAYDKRIRVLAASQATQPAGEAGALGMGYLSYALVKNGLEANQADWQPKDGAIWLREWLAYGVEAVPKLYADVREGRNPVAGNLKGIVANRNHGVSLQTPALFDFRPEPDRGVRLK